MRIYFVRAPETRNEIENEPAPTKSLRSGPANKVLHLRGGAGVHFAGLIGEHKIVFPEDDPHFGSRAASTSFTLCTFSPAGPDLFLFLRSELPTATHFCI